METTADSSRGIGSTITLIVVVTLMWATRLLGLLIFVLSLVVAWQAGNGMALVLTMILPPVAQMYWVWEAFALTGNPFTIYATACYIWAAMMLVQLIVVTVIDRH